MTDTQARWVVRHHGGESGHRSFFGGQHSRGRVVARIGSFLAGIVLTPLIGWPGLLIGATLAGPASAQSFGFASFHALVGPTGAVLRGSGVKAVTHQPAGRYFVQFTRRVNLIACVYTATLISAQGGQISAQVVAGKVGVMTYRAAATFSNYLAIEP